MDLTYRNRLESKVQAGVRRAFKTPRQAAGNRQPGWTTLKRDLIAEVLPTLEKVQTDAIRQMFAVYGDGPAPDWVKPNADKRASDLADDLIAVSKRRWNKMKRPRSKADIAAWRQENFGTARSKLIAITEVTIAQQAGEDIAWAALKKMGVKLEGYWQTERNPCKFCKRMNGKPSKVWRKVYPKGPPSPHPGCVLGETPVLVPGCISAMLAEYEGPIVRIKTASGGSFAVSPNHMLLCDIGFVRAADLMNGMNVVSSLACKWEVASDPNDDWKPPVAEQVFSSGLVSRSMAASRVPVSTEHLHGDGAFAKGEIDIVDMHGFLWHEGNAKLIEVASQLDFILGCLGMALSIGNPFDGPRPKYAGFDASCTSAAGGISITREMLALVNGHALHPNGISFASGPGVNAETLEVCHNAAARHQQIVRNFLDAMPEVIARDQITRVEVDSFHGSIPVYDFETESSLYAISNGIISSNCRCEIAYKKLSK